jgi:hypothetical protein
MEIVAEMDAACPPEQLFGWVADLGCYPRWLEIVTRAEPEPADASTTAPDPAGTATTEDAAPPSDGEPAWAVDLRGRMGPLARSKRLRMARTLHEPGRRVRFERRELDGRSHSPWTLDARVEPRADGSRLVMTLHYGGSLFGPVLERVLREEIERSRPRLAALAAGATGTSV